MTETYNGKQFPIKECNGYRFATDALFNELWDDSIHNFKDDEAVVIDMTIAFYFDEEEFNNNDAATLLHIYNSHS